MTWKNLTDGSFKGFTFHVAVPQKGKGHGISSDEVSYERRLQVTKRANVDGAETSDFGRDARSFSAEIVFFGANYVADLQAFEKILNEGTPGILTLPDEPVSVLASFARISKKADSSGGNTKMLSVTWVEAEQTPTTFIDTTATAASTVRPSVVASASKTKNLISAAQTVVKGNPLLAAVRTFESGLSAARSSVNTVLTLTDGVRNRIAAIDANIQGTLSLMNDAVDELTNLFGNETAARSALVFSSNIDPETGQRVASFQEPDEVTVAPDPLDAPATPLTISVDIGSIQSEASAQSALDKLSSSMSSDNSELLGSTEGRTDDVSLALTLVVASLKELGQSIQTRQTKRVVVPIEMSLNEVLFHNDRTVDDLDDVYKLNTHIEDPLIVSAGTVVVV